MNKYASAQPFVGDQGTEPGKDLAGGQLKGGPDWRRLFGQTSGDEIVHQAQHSHPI